MEHILVSAAFAILFAWVIYRASRFYLEHLRRDTKRLEIAHHALVKHRQAIESLCGMDRLDPLARELVIGFAQDVVDHDAARDLVNFLSRGDDGGDGEQSPQSIALGEAMSRDKAVAQLVHAAVKHGLVAMVLQWTDTAKQMTAALAELAVDDEREITRAVAAVRGHRRPRSNRHHDDMDQGLVPA